AERMETNAEVSLDKAADGFAITAVHLTLKAKVPGTDQATFQELAAKGQGRLSRFQAAQRQDHAGRDAGQLIGGDDRILAGPGRIGALCGKWEGAQMWKG